MKHPITPAVVDQHEELRRIAREHSASMRIDAGLEHDLRLPAGFADRAKLVDVFTFPHPDGRNQQPRRMTREQVVEEVSRQVAAMPNVKVFANNQLCEPWQPDGESLIDTEALQPVPGVYSPDQGEAGLHVATAEGVVRVDADISDEELAEIHQADELRASAEALLEDGFGTASWLFGEANRLTAMVRENPMVDRRVRVWMGPSAESAEFIDERGHIDTEHCILQLEFDGVPILSWNHMASPAMDDDLNEIAFGVSFAIQYAERDARNEGREEIRSHLRKALGK